MCKCTPEMRTPWCGKQGCEPPAQKTSKIAVLCAMKNSNYNEFDGLEIYDEERNAFYFHGGMTVIAHPPCRLFSRMRAFSTAPETEKELAYFCVEKVRENGGILEHPYGSRLWDEAGLPKQGFDIFGGFTMRLLQYHFGHDASKDTILYIVGITPDKLPFLPIRIGLPETTVGTTKKKYRTKREIPKRQRAETPTAFCEWLITIANRIQKNRLTT